MNSKTKSIQEAKLAEIEIQKEIDAMEEEGVVLYEGKLSDNIVSQYTDKDQIVRKTTIKRNDKDDVKRRIVYNGYFRPVSRLDIDGARFIEVELEQTIIGNISDILGFMRQNGGVVSQSNLADCVNAIISSAPLELKKGHATFGVYNDERLSLCLDPYCVSDEHNRIKRQVKKAKSEKLDKKKIQRYIDIASFWHPYEVFPVMSYGIMSTFAYALKEKENILIPYLFHSSPESGLGKTKTAEIFSQNLFGVLSESMAAVYSDFRLADTLDSFCGLKCINEAQKYNWKGKLAEKIKQSAESPIQDKRGSSSRGSKLYLSRLVGVFTGNGFPIQGKSQLVRFFRIEFDMSAKSDRSKRNKNKNLIKKIRNLKPIGFRLVEEELDDLNYSIDELINRIENYGDLIVDNYSGTFYDQRRPTAWGFVYEGLKVWERICKKYDVKWQAPSIKDFVKNVVKKIENTTFESKELPVEDFFDWFETFKIRDNGKSEDKIWRLYILEHNFKEYPGSVITSPILKQYNRNNNQSEIKNMGDLARSISGLTGLPVEEIYEPKRYKINGITKKGVFIPDSLFELAKKHGNSVTGSESTGEKKGYLQKETDNTKGNHIEQEKKGD